MKTMTPWDVFRRLLPESGYALTRIPGRNGGADPDNGVIYLGADLDDVTAGIVGLHELGHLMTGATRFRGLLCSLAFVHEVYAQELQAWAWAAAVMPAGWEFQFEAAREQGLESYRR